MTFLPGLLMLLFTISHAAPPQLSSRELDSLLQDYAFRALLSRPKTGTPYPGRVPGNLTGVKLSAVRLRSGSLRARGFNNLGEFSIPKGLVERPYVKRLAFVYQNLGNWSFSYYPLPGYTFLAPILGLLAYNASDLSTKREPELDLWVSEKPILIKFRNLKSVPSNGSFSVPKCVYFDLHGSVEFSNVLPGNVCLTTSQGHFSIVSELTPPSVDNPPPSSSVRGGGSGGGEKWNRRRVWLLIGGSAVFGCLVLVLFGGLVQWVRKSRRGRRIRGMEEIAEGSVPLEEKTFGSSRVPIATATRTRPVLENEYVP